MVVKTRLRITANVITDKGIRVGPENTALNFQQIVSVEEYFFLYYNSSMLKVMAMKPLDYTRVILKVNNYITRSGQGIRLFKVRFSYRYCAIVTIRLVSFSMNPISVKCPKLSLRSGVFVSPSNCRSSNQAYGSTCSFSCARGYRLIGPSSTQCGKGGVWNQRPSTVRCEGEKLLMTWCVS